ncbi:MULTISPECIES: AI-2E family transporter [unclassified Ornithinimicrobium]|uniref:AI-2E family transporter n=1 Tax=unclassified Ornithinimicrobium TaxID=2615080 RepID=UPI003852E82D
MSTTNLGDPGSRLRRWGIRGWLVGGIAVGTLVLVSVVGQVSGLAVPLVIAAVLGALFAPEVERLARHGIPRPVGALLVIALLAGVLAATVWLVVVGIAERAPQISASMAAGLDAVEGWLGTRGISVGDASLREQAAELLAASMGGAASAYLPGLLTGTASFAIGIVVGTFLVYYILTDWNGLTAWAARNLGVAGDVGAGIVEDTIGAVRRYFSSLTLSAVVTAVLIGGAAWVLEVPLAFTIAVITLVTSYVPYLGAIFSGAFATLITIGTTDARTALLMLLVVLVVQNIVQTVVLTRLTSTALRLHPIVTLGATIVGAALAGALGAMLSSPAVAVWILVLRRLRREEAEVQNLHTSGT